MSRFGKAALRRLMVSGIVMSAAGAGALPIGSAALAQARATFSFDIPAQPLGSALSAFARQSREQLLYAPDLVAGRQSAPLKGTYSSEEALDRLLAGSGLRFKATSSGAYSLFSAADPAAEASAAQDTAAMADQAEIIVTATKRPEPVRRIAGSVSALSGPQLERLGAQGMADYLARTPGVVFNAARPGDGSIAIRGIATTTGRDQGQPTTGIFINDVPLTDPSISIGTPDIDTFDVDNVTVLRGPQGTLFGSASLGGAVNYQANRPDVAGWDVRAQATLSDTRYGNVGGAGKIMMNLPVVAGSLAVRGVFVYREDAGYIDNLGTGDRDANRTVTKGGRLLATWKPGPDTDINYMYLEQTQQNDDAGFQQPVLSGRLRKSTLFPDRSVYNTLIHNLRADQELGFATLTATATSHQKKNRSEDDFTTSLSALLFGLAPIASDGNGKNRGETYEVRLASAPGGPLEYVVGLMHDDTKTSLTQAVTAAGLEAFVEANFGPGSGASIAPDDLVLRGSVQGRAQESAIFGEGTYHLSDALKATLGGRLFEQKLRLRSMNSGLLPALSGGPTDLDGVQKSDGFNPKASVTWTPDRSLMGYALVSKGFRFGGPNVIPAVPGSSVPPQFQSDSLWNYELGMRADLMDRRLLLDLTAFYVDWSDIQLRLTSGSLNYADNAGTARSYGLEASATLRPLDGVNLTSNATYLNAKLTEAFDPDLAGPAPAVPSGTTLPGASKWQVSNVASYDYRAGAIDWTFLVSHRYTSRAPGALVAGSLISGAAQGGYHLFGARAGLRRENFGLTLFVDNIGDARGVTSGTSDPLEQFIVRPRTIGVTLDYRM